MSSHGTGLAPDDSHEAGKVLVAIERPDGQELRIEWAEYRGHPYLSLRLWGKDRAGRWWPDPKRGVSVRLGELEEARDAIEEAIRLADDYCRARDSSRQLRAAEPRAQNARPRLAQPGRARQPASKSPQERPLWAATLPQTVTSQKGLPFNEFE
jgi:hypothetical protein